MFVYLFIGKVILPWFYIYIYTYNYLHYKWILFTIVKLIICIVYGDFIFITIYLQTGFKKIRVSSMYLFHRMNYFSIIILQSIIKSSLEFLENNFQRVCILPKRKRKEKFNTNAQKLKNPCYPSLYLSLPHPHFPLGNDSKTKNSSRGKFTKRLAATYTQFKLYSRCDACSSPHSSLPGRMHYRATGAITLVN